MDTRTHYRDITRHQPLPGKSESSIRIISYNITVDFFDGRDKTEDKIHVWSSRSSLCKELICKVNADIVCLQELSPSQASELSEYFDRRGYESLFLSQTPSDIDAGVILKGEDTRALIGKNIGTAFTGTFYKKEYQVLNSGRFWFNEDPDTVPTSKDRGTVDKGFGNMNTYRACMFLKLKIPGHNKSIHIFNSHYPLSGGNATRGKCSELEMLKIHELVQGDSWVSAGDRNFIPDSEGIDDAYNNFTNAGYDARDSSNHYGISTTWLGYTYDQFKNILKHTPGGVDFSQRNTLDMLISGVKSDMSFHLHGAFSTDGLLPLTAQLSKKYNDDRKFTSDHALVGADFNIESL